MKSFFVRPVLAIIMVLALALPVFAGQLDDYYLAAFGEQYGNALEKNLLLQSDESAGRLHCGMPLKHALQRDWRKLQPETQKVLAKQLAAPTLSGTELIFKSSGGHFNIHYASSGTDAPPALDANSNGIPDWVETVATTMEQTLSSYISLGYRSAPTVSDEPYDVYLRELAPLRLYGQTTTTQAVPSGGFANAFASFMEIDNDYQESVYINTGGGPYTPLQSLQITAAHEYHHAIQYGYNYFFDIWYAEATSTWFEDELIDSVNQLYNYVPDWFSNTNLSLDTGVSVYTGGGYGRWIFNRYLAEQHGTGVIRATWEKLATLNSPDNINDIPMVPVLENLLSTSPYSSTLGADFFGFTKRVYMRDWSSHSNEINLIHTYSPVSTFSSFPASYSNSLAHYSFAFFKFTPSATVPTLNISLNKTSGIQTALFKTVGGIPAEITANSDGSYTVAGFGSMRPAFDEVVLLVTNKTGVDNHQFSFSTNGNPAMVNEPNAPVTPPVSSGRSGGGGGCFIATAAYGSYLHPQVQVLREFRDKYLLNNAPGQAFVSLYYTLSPPMADFIAQHGTLRLLVRLMLTPLILSVKYPCALGASLLLAAFYKLMAIRRRPVTATERS